MVSTVPGRQQVRVSLKVPKARLSCRAAPLLHSPKEKQGPEMSLNRAPGLGCGDPGEAGQGHEGPQ